MRVEHLSDFESRSASGPNYLYAKEFDVFLLNVDGSDSGTTFSVNPFRFGFNTAINLNFWCINTLLTVDYKTSKNLQFLRGSLGPIWRGRG